MEVSAQMFANTHARKTAKLISSVCMPHPTLSLRTTTQHPSKYFLTSETLISSTKRWCYYPLRMCFCSSGMRLNWRPHHKAPTEQVLALARYPYPDSLALACAFTLKPVPLPFLGSQCSYIGLTSPTQPHCLLGSFLTQKIKRFKIH